VPGRPVAVRLGRPWSGGRQGCTGLVPAGEQFCADGRPCSLPEPEQGCDISSSVAARRRLGPGLDAWAGVGCAGAGTVCAGRRPERVGVPAPRYGDGVCSAVPRVRNATALAGGCGCVRRMRRSHRAPALPEAWVLWGGCSAGPYLLSAEPPIDDRSPSPAYVACIALAEACPVSLLWIRPSCFDVRSHHGLLSRRLRPAAPWRRNPSSP
jgi:hypothetical protein